MKLIAFKRAKQHEQAKDILHPEFITEYADTDLFPPNFHKAEDGFEFLAEDLFNIELLKNPSLHAKNLAEKQKLEQARNKVAEQVAKVKEVEDKQLKREFEEFKAWKEQKDKK